MMKDRQGAILYVGKSKSLRKRLASYFHNHAKGSHTARLVKRIAEIEVILVNNETESFLLENNLIARHQPPFNRLMWRTDKGYPYLALTQEQFPRLVPYQAGHPNKELGEATILHRFGPFLSHRFCLGVLEFGRDYFQLRTCQPLARAVCLRFHLQQCSGICEQRVSEEQYDASVENAILFLTSKPTEIIDRIQQQMWKYAEKMAFERAQRLKELIAVLEGALGGQLIERKVDHDQELIYFGEDGALTASFKKGSLIGMQQFGLDGNTDPTEARAQVINSCSGRREFCEVIVNDFKGLDKLNGIPGGCTVRSAQHETEVALLELCRMNYIYRSSHQPQIPR